MIKTDEHIIVIGMARRTLFRSAILIKLIQKCKLLHIDLMVVSHFPVSDDIQQSVNYVIYDCKNELLLPEHYITMGSKMEHYYGNSIFAERMTNPYRHDYTIWCNWRNALNLIRNKKYVHYMDYDVDLDINNFTSESLAHIETYDACVYNYATSPAPTWINSSYFSLRYELFKKIVDSIPTMEYYYTGSTEPESIMLENKLIKEILKNISLERVYTEGSHIHTLASCLTNLFGQADELYDMAYHVSFSEGGDLYLSVRTFSTIIPYIQWDVLVNNKNILLLTKDNLKSDSNHMIRIGSYGDTVMIKDHNIVLWEFDTGKESYDRLYYFNNVRFYNDQLPELYFINYFSY